MSLGSSLKLLGAGAAWRSLGVAAAGEALVAATGSEDEQERMLAGMSLVKAGDRSIGLIEQAAESGRLTPTLVQVLADIGGPQARALLTGVAGEAGPLGEAASRSLNLLDRIDSLDEED